MKFFIPCFLDYNKTVVFPDGTSGIKNVTNHISWELAYDETMAQTAHGLV
jgi:hypothetical protein